MTTVLKLTVCLSLFVYVFSKQQQNIMELEMKNTFLKHFNDEELSQAKERFARHVEMVTESVIDHLFKELRHQYQNKNYNSNSPVRRLLRDLNKEMKRNEHNKMVKDKKAKKMANKKKHNIIKKNKKKTSRH